MRQSGGFYFCGHFCPTSGCVRVVLVNYFMSSRVQGQAEILKSSGGGLTTSPTPPLLKQQLCLQAITSVMRVLRGEVAHVIVSWSRGSFLINIPNRSPCFSHFHPCFLNVFGMVSEQREVICIKNVHFHFLKFLRNIRHIAAASRKTDISTLSFTEQSSPGQKHASPHLCHCVTVRKALKSPCVPRHNVRGAEGDGYSKRELS